MKILIIVNFVLMFLLISGCGSIKGHHNIIPVDSYPRNAIVLDDKKNVIGKTPFFYKISPDPLQNIQFELNSETHTLTYQCGLNWTQSILPAIIMSTLPPIGIIAGGISLLADTITGGIFICEKPLFSYFNQSQAVSSPKTILIFPPQIGDPELATVVVQSWLKKFNEVNQSSSDTVIPYDIGRYELSLIGIDHHNCPSPSNIRNSFLTKLGQRYHITHILQFSLTSDKDTDLLNFSPEIYDIFTLQKDNPSLSYLQEFSIKSPDYLKNRYRRWILNAFSILPNSIQLGNTQQAQTKISSQMFPEQNGTVDSKRHPDAVPKFLTLFSAGVIDHPQFFNTWDYNFSFFPSFNSSAWQNTFATGDHFYQIKLFNFYAFYNTSLTFHTSFGAVGADLGIGLIYFTGSDTQRNRYNLIESAGRLNLHFVAFATDRIYFRIDGTSYTPHQHRIRSEFYRLDSWKEVFLGVGYYLPSLKNWARKLLPF